MLTVAQISAPAARYIQMASGLVCDFSVFLREAGIAFGVLARYEYNLPKIQRPEDSART